MIQTQTILIVDDEEIVRRLLQQTLAGAGFSCLEAGEAGAALELLKHNSVDIVLMDINMPGRSGVELLADVTANFPDIAVIMLTAVTENDICIDCMHRGAYDYITKPFYSRELVIRVKQALEKRMLRLNNRQYQLHLEERVEEQSVRIRNAFFNAIAALAQALEAKDKYTSGHSQRVAAISTAIAQQLSMATDQIENIRLAALVHDIGKIGITESVLNKPGRLTDEEFGHVRLHCEIGERILKPITQDDEILSMVRHHHERFDGTGYPDGLKGTGEQASACYGILALADTYDAMTSDRPYRRALSMEQAWQEIKDHSGSQFDPVVVEAFLSTTSSSKT